MKAHRMLVAVFWFAACEDRTPVRIEFARQSLMLLDSAPAPLEAHLAGASGIDLGSAGLEYSATPSSTISVTASGIVACRASGDGTVNISWGTLGAPVAVHCRLVTTVRGPDSVRLVLGRVPEVATLTAIDAAGIPFADVQVDATMLDSRIASVHGGRLTPAAVGSTILVASIGSVKKYIPVTVFELLKSEPIALADGESITWTLPPGSYELELTVKPIRGVKDGVTVSWVGAGCPDEPEAQQQSVVCTLRQAAGLTVRNPTTFGLGTPVHGIMNVYRTAR